MLDVILKRFEEPDEVREMVKGKFEIVHLGGLTIGRDSSGKPVYALTMPNEVSMHERPDRLDTDLGERFRSYLRDESGALHAYGGTRDASRDDPPPQPDELAAAQERLESWWKSLRSSEVYDSIGKVRWDSTRKFRADSARRDSADRGLFTAR